MINAPTDTERALLSALVLDPSRIPEVSETVSGADFADCHLGHFFDVVVTAYEAGLPIGDPKCLLPELRRNAVNTAVSNNAYVGRLFMEGIACNAKHYAAQLHRASLLRLQADIAHDLLERTSQHDADPAVIAAWLDSQLARTGIVDSFACRTIGEIAKDYIEDLRRPETRDRIVMSGLSSLDGTVGGWMPGELIVLAARTGMGKSALSMQMATHAAAHGKSVLFVSLEMRDRELVGRILCGAAGVNSRRIRSGRHDEHDIASIEYQASRIHDHPLYVWDPSRATTGQIRARAKRILAVAGLNLLIVDYIGLVQPSDRSRQRYEQVGQVTCDLKALAKELEIPVLALCQLNREADGAEPKLSHLRESGSVEQDADVVLFIHRESKEATEATLIVAKHRHSCTGKLPMTWVPDRTCFETEPVVQCYSTDEFC